MTTHKLKILENYALDHLCGLKPWELRKNDRDYKAGDFIEFTAINNDNKPTGLTYTRIIKYVHTGGAYGLDPDYCIITLSKLI